MLGNKDIMARNIRHYMELFGKTRNDMCEALGVKYTTFTDWINAKTYPRIDKIELMAEYFGIEKSDLIEDKGKDTMPVSPAAKKHMENYSQLTAEWQKTIDELIQTLQSEAPDSDKLLEVIGKITTILHS